MGSRSTPIVDFQKNLAFGQVGENYIGNWLLTQGYMVLPVYEVEGGDHKGPRFHETPTRRHVAPDILAFKGERIVWIEAKHKTVFSWHRKTGRWVTGIDLHHYEQYLKIAEKTGKEVWLLFLHREPLTNEGCGVCPTGLFGQKLSVLADNESHRHANWGKSGMVYWADSSLKKLAELHEVLPDSFFR